MLVASLTTCMIGLSPRRKDRKGPTAVYSYSMVCAAFVIL